MSDPARVEVLPLEIRAGLDHVLQWEEAGVCGEEERQGRDESDVEEA